eukprot:3912545-Pleurochrysis_carterae.AAC.1
MPAEIAIAASERSDVGRIVAQKAGLERSATFALVHPDESNDGAIRRDVRAVDERPATVFSVVIDFGTFGAAPANAVFGHRLFASARVTGHVVDGERAAGTPSPRWLVGACACEEEGRRLARSKRIRAESSLEVWRCRQLLRSFGRGRSGSSARGRH